MLVGCPPPKPVACPRVVLCVYEGFPLQVCTDCQAVPRAGEGSPVVGDIPHMKLPEDRDHLDFLRGVILNFKCPQATWTWQTFKLTFNIGHRLCLQHCFFTAGISNCNELLSPLTLAIFEGKCLLPHFYICLSATTQCIFVEQKTLNE